MPDSPRPLLITGCGRSGTKYASVLLSKLGLRCQHEKVFTGRPTDHGQIPPGQAEASWFAVPYLHKAPKNTLVMHQVRHPMGTIRSYYNMGFFRLNAKEDNNPLKHYAKRLLKRAPSGQYRLTQMVKELMPEIFESRDPAVRSAIFWVLWNQRVAFECERLGLEYRRVRLEDINATLMRSVLDQLNIPEGKPIEEALAAVPKTVNARERKHLLTWAELGTAADAVRELATTYGYSDLSD